MKKYTVHVYAIVRVAVTGIEADNDFEAVEKADKIVTPDYFSYALTKLPHEAEYSGETSGYVVDELDEMGERVHPDGVDYVYGPRGLQRSFGTKGGIKE